MHESGDIEIRPHICRLLYLFGFISDEARSVDTDTCFQKQVKFSFIIYRN